MNTTDTAQLMSAAYIRVQIADWEREINRYLLCSRILETLGAQLSENVCFYPAFFIQVTVSNRADLQALMTLAPLWDKHAVDDGIAYNATVEGERFQIVAKSAALPQTCKMVEEEYEIPAVAAKPAGKGRRMVLKCDNEEALTVEANQEGDL